MKAFLLAGGYGTRLRPLTDSLPKCLVPIRGRALLDIWLELCARHGISEVLINVHAHAGQVEKHLHRSDPPVQVRLVHEELLLGSAGTIAANRQWVAHEQAFFIFYSDVLTCTNLADMVEFHLEHMPVATLGLYQVPTPERCGVAITNGEGMIVEFAEKPKAPRSNWVFSGVMLATAALFDAIPVSAPADLGFHVLPRLTGKMRAYPITEFLIDIGTPANYRLAQQTWPGLKGDFGEPAAQPPIQPQIPRARSAKRARAHRAGR